MIVDTDGTSCLTVNFGIGGTTGTSRNWDIMVSMNKLARLFQGTKCNIDSQMQHNLNCSLIILDNSV